MALGTGTSVYEKACINGPSPNSELNYSSDNNLFAFLTIKGWLNMISMVGRLSGFFSNIILHIAHTSFE